MAIEEWGPITFGTVDFTWSANRCIQVEINEDDADLAGPPTLLMMTADEAHMPAAVLLHAAHHRDPALSDDGYLEAVEADCGVCREEARSASTSTP
jgi:hypothetical protein